MVIKKIGLTVLVAIISVTLIFPLLLKLNFIQGFFKITSIELFIGITAIILAILLFYREKRKLYWKRYSETKKTGNFSLAPVDLIFIYIILATLLVFVIRTFEEIFKDNSPLRKGIETSIEFGYFLWFLLIGLLIFFFIWLILFVKGLLIKRKSSKNDNVDRILLDEPITSPKQDILRREKFVADLSEIILNLPSKLTGSFTIGLNGSWGEGKTSVINLLIEKLKESPDFNDNFLLIQFDPWYFGDEKAILNAFYDQLEKAFSEKFIFPDIKKGIARYLKIISTGVSLPGIKFEIRSSDLSIEQTKKQIERYIIKMGRKVFIIIDDIDRLQPDEMAFVFKLVRQNSNFKNTIFLLSFEESIVRKTLFKEAEIEEDFLEKIINKPIPLPAIEQKSIDDYLLEEIKQLLNAIKIPEDEMAILLNEFSNVYRFTIKMQKLFKTIRLTKRYINSLYSSLPSIKTEVYPLDFLLLEIIRIFNTDLYKDIWSNQWYYIEQKNIEREISSPLHSLNGDKKYNAIKAHVENLLENKPGAEIFKRLLIELFPGFFHKVWPDIILMKFNTPPFRSYRGDRVEKRIYHPDCLPKYFLLQVPLLEISDEQLETVISTWESMLQKERKESIKQELFEKDNEGNAWTSRWIEKLMDFVEKIGSPLALSIIEVIYENAGAFTRGPNFVLDSEFLKAAWLMIILIDGKTQKQSIPEVLEDALMKTPNLLFSTFIIWECKNKEDIPISSIYSIDLKPFQDKVAQRLNEYFVDNKRDIFEIYNDPNEWDFILKIWGTNWNSWDGQFCEIIQNYVLSLVKDDAQKFYKFLYKMICEAPHPIISKSKLDEFKRHYNVTKFKEIALKFKDNESLSDKERELISQFLESVPLDQPQLSQE